MQIFYLYQVKSTYFRFSIHPLYLIILVNLIWVYSCDSSSVQDQRGEGRETAEYVEDQGGLTLEDEDGLNTDTRDMESEYEAGSGGVEAEEVINTLTCESYGALSRVSNLDTQDLIEISGITFSGLRADLLWSHNDSGNDPNLFAIQTSGEVLGSLQIPHDVFDLEDIERAPCPHQPRDCLWVADIGDNFSARPDVAIYIVPEPIVAGKFDQKIIDEESILIIRGRYEGGPADAEALIVDHLGEVAWIIEKVEERATRIWRLDVSMRDRASEPTIWEEVVRFNSPGVSIAQGKLITAAALSPDGLRLIIRVYTGIYEYHLPAPYALEALPALEPLLITLGPLSEPQGEAVSYGWRGEGVWSISEDSDGYQPLHYIPCMSR